MYYFPGLENILLILPENVQIISHLFYGVLAYCSSWLQPNADLNYEVPSLVLSKASEGWLSAGHTRGRERRGQAGSSSVTGSS